MRYDSTFQQLRRVFEDDMVFGINNQARPPTWVSKKGNRPCEEPRTDTNKLILKDQRRNLQPRDAIVLAFFLLFPNVGLNGHVTQSNVWQSPDVFHYVSSVEFVR
ncbi:hypothetical protein NQ318_001881 [Aromia moschata]|uniref:Uncharacterized protein n=1 Tax=Aromia moschata TaxID=1265417 RepID=A0AAV8Z2V9_9CUCU|nr:hypothetical protein NQ318_001881 [Aromia moschata]